MEPKDEAQAAEIPAITHNLFTPEFSRDPQPAYKALRDECPIARNPLTGAVMISRFEDVQWALRHPEYFSSEVDSLKIGQERPIIPLQLDPPEQTKYRKLLDPLFSRRRMLILEPDIRARANRLIDGFADRGECDFNEEFAIPLPSAVFLALLGLPYESLDDFLEIKDGILRPQTTDPAESQRIREESGKRCYALFERTLDERKKSPREDILSWMQGAEVDGHRLSREQILDICYLLLIAGLDTVTATLDCFVAYLAQHPDRRRMAIEHPEMVDGIIEELMRTETPVMMVVRTIKQDVTLGGHQLVKGQNVALALGAADTDEREFEGGAAVDFTRSPNRHVAFGGGAHRCLGSHLARIELRVALEEFHRRIPEYSVKPGVELQYSPGIRQILGLPLVFST